MRPTTDVSPHSAPRRSLQLQISHESRREDRLGARSPQRSSIRRTAPCARDPERPRKMPKLHAGRVQLAVDLDPKRLA